MGQLSEKGIAFLNMENQLHYKANVTAGALLVPESRKIAELLLSSVTPDQWKDAVENKNIIQQRSLSSSKRIAALIRSRLELMKPELWKLICEGYSTTATHAVFASAIKHSRLLGDYLDTTVRQQFRKLYDKLTPMLWDDFILSCKQRDPQMQDFPPTTTKKVCSNIHKILTEAGYIKGRNDWTLQKVDIAPKVLRYLKKNDEQYVLKCIQVGND